MPGQAHRLDYSLQCHMPIVINRKQLLETGQKAYILGTHKSIVLFVKLHCYLKDLNLVKNQPQPHTLEYTY